MQCFPQVTKMRNKAHNASEQCNEKQPQKHILQSFSTGQCAFIRGFFSVTSSFYFVRLSINSFLFSEDSHTHTVSHCNTSQNYRDIYRYVHTYTATILRLNRWQKAELKECTTKTLQTNQKRCVHLKKANFTKKKKNSLTQNIIVQLKQEELRQNKDKMKKKLCSRPTESWHSNKRGHFHLKDEYEAKPAHDFHLINVKTWKEKTINRIIRLFTKERSGWEGGGGVVMIQNSKLS